jgi:hypothetical protein
VRALIDGRIEQRKLPSGATEIVSVDHPDLPQTDLATVIARMRDAMSGER